MDGKETQNNYKETHSDYKETQNVHKDTKWLQRQLKETQNDNKEAKWLQRWLQKCTKLHSRQKMATKTSTKTHETVTNTQNGYEDDYKKIESDNTNWPYVGGVGLPMSVSRDLLSCNLSMVALMISPTFHRTTEGLDMTLKGKYLVTVSATDTGGLSTSTILDVSDWNHAAGFSFMTCSETLSCLCCKQQADSNTSASVETSVLFILQIFTVDESYKVELEFTSSGDEVEQNINEIERCISPAFNSVLVKFESDDRELKNFSICYLVNTWIHPVSHWAFGVFSFPARSLLPPRLMLKLLPSSLALKNPGKFLLSSPLNLNHHTSKSIIQSVNTDHTLLAGGTIFSFSYIRYCPLGGASVPVNDHIVKEKWFADKRGW